MMYEISSEGYYFENCLPSDVIGKEYDKFLRLDFSMVRIDKVELTTGFDPTEGITYPIMNMYISEKTYSLILECVFYSHWQGSAPMELNLPDSSLILRLMETSHSLKLSGDFMPGDYESCTLSFENNEETFIPMDLQVSPETLIIECVRVNVLSISQHVNN